MLEESTLKTKNKILPRASQQGLEVCLRTKLQTSAKLLVSIIPEPAKTFHISTKTKITHSENNIRFTEQTIISWHDIINDGRV